MKTLAYDALQTPLGSVFLLCDEQALCAVEFDGYAERMHALARKRYGVYELEAVRDPLGMTSVLRAYFAGDVHAIDAVAATAGGTPYQARVWQALRTIPNGETRSYGELAAQLGATHARAVGHANSLNPVAIVIPCHRVIGANAALTGYAGGLEKKRWLLAHERAHARLAGPLQLRAF
ncbi:MAG: methylated-DNA--[protein]-cysteine S-methyltransferase [Candidatus Velthaea sp.]